MILFIDDELRQMENYIEELRLSGHEVEFKNNVDDALIFLEINIAKLKIIILDIMMPPGKLFQNGDVEYGLRTGVKFYRKIRTLSNKIKVVVLTNVSDEKVAEQFQNEKNCWFFPKEEILPYQLAEKVRAIVDARE